MGDVIMKSHQWKSYLLWIFLTESVGILSTLLSRNGIASFQNTVLQLSNSPPPFLFPIVWGIIYGLMGISAARVYRTPSGKNRSQSLNLFIAQLTVNFFWSLIFFNAKAYGFAFIWLIILLSLAIWMVLMFYQSDPVASYLQIPYILWLSYAAYLSYNVWQLNK